MTPQLYGIEGNFCTNAFPDVAPQGKGSPQDLGTWACRRKRLIPPYGWLVTWLTMRGIVFLGASESRREASCVHSIGFFIFPVPEVLHDIKDERDG